MSTTTKSSYFCVQVHSLGWLFIANTVGVILASLLLIPELNSTISPYTYGRLMPLHLNFQLYGWMSTPLLGLLLAWYVRPEWSGSSICNWSLLLWSATLALGGWSWANGGSSGKLFLDWNGAIRGCFLAMLAVQWLLLALSYFRRLRITGFSEEGGWFFVVCKSVLLFGMAFVPVSFLIALEPDVYPPINNLSSGATGASLLISSLGILTVFWISPLILTQVRRQVFAPGLLLLCLVLHFLFWSSIDHGNSNNHDKTQIFALGTLLIWVPLLTWYYKQFAWRNGSQLWLCCFGLWGTVLAVTAFVMFLPGILEALKFTNALVAHVHLAMAGMLSSFLMVVLLCIGPEANSPRVIAHTVPCITWNIGLLIYLSAMLYVGTIESNHVDFLYRAYNEKYAAYSLRFVGGVLMTSASLYWLVVTIRRGDCPGGWEA